MTDVSVIIPARNEEFLSLTIDDVLAKARADTEVIAILDGYWPETPIKDQKNLTIIHHDGSIGQRAATNEGARLSKAKYVMKLDAHCKVDEGFDVKLMADCKPDWTVIPQMYNLHAFDWECQQCGDRTYQGPKPKKCAKCGCDKVEKRIVWKRRKKRHTEFWRFDKDLVFQYWTKYNNRPEAKAPIADTLSAIGACFFMHRDRYFEIDGLDEGHGSWGQVGTEIACKSWLSGGRHVVNKKTWFAHMFRTNNNGFSFPYPNSQKAVERARAYSRKLWIDNTWPKAKHDLNWLISKFAPVPDWHDTPILSVIIPARNEKYLQDTVDDIIKNFKTDFEIIVGLDDYDADLKKDRRVRVYRSDKRIGMRPMINKLVSMARGRYIMKTDAHCSFARGYDQSLINIHQKGYTVLGIRYELDVNKWEKKERTNCDFRYLSNPKVDELGGLRGLPWHEWKKRTKGQKVAESMSLSGSGWLMEKAQFNAWGGLDENHGTMYQEGCEIACKTWLSGGRLLIDRKTWYAHWNRGKAPYALSTKHRQKSIDYSIDYWMNDRWPLQKYSFNWLLEYFNPPGWDFEVTEVRAKKQGTLFKGSRVKYRDKHRDLSVSYLWKHRIGISEPLKRWRLKIFFDSYSELLEQVKKGEAFTDEEAQQTRYFNYLVTHLAKFVYPQDREAYIKKYKKRLLRKFRSGIDLYYDIKRNGLYKPLEFYNKDKKTYLWKGYRRLVVLNALGVKEVPIVTHMTEKCKQLPKMFIPVSKSESIDKLARKQFVKYGGKSTDKYWTHRYTPIYDKLFSHLRNSKINLLELGVARGASLRLWYHAFPRGQILGLDKNKTIWKEMTPESDRVKVFVGKQQDESLLKKITDKYAFDIVIDDCGHNPDLQFHSFKNLWHSVKPHGFYIIEDCYISYLDRNKGRINIPKHLSQWVESIYKDQEVWSLQFYYNMCVIQKGV